MDKIDLIKLKKLTALCRKLGIHHLKSDGFEIDLSSIEPTQPVRRKKKQSEEASSLAQDIETEALSADEMLFWSSTPDPEESDLN